MTGLVYLAIIALWVMFLIPWLGRHREEHNGRRSADRYHRAMDTLARARQTLRYPDEDAALHDLGDSALDESAADPLDYRGPVLAPATSSAGTGDVWPALVDAVRPSLATRKSPAARRRRLVLGILVMAVAASLVAAVTGYVPAAVALVFVVLLVSYVTLLVRKGLRSRGAHGARGATAESDRYREATRRARAQARGMLEPRSEIVPQADGWEAVPTTLPTYVTKPRAAKVPRVVDLASSRGDWNGQAMVQAAQEEQRHSQAAALAQFRREMAAVEPDPTDAVAELANPAEQANWPRQSYRRAANG